MTKTPKKHAATLPDSVAALGRLTDAGGKKADAAIANMPAKLTPGQKRRLMQDALQSRVVAHDMVKRLEASAKEAERLATVRRFTSADRRWLRHHLAIVGSLEFAKL